MEIFGTVVSSEGRPIGGAIITRLYPNGQQYDLSIIADQNGNFNGRVPGREYSWVVSAAGFFPAEVLLTDALHNEPTRPKVVTLSPLFSVPVVADQLQADNTLLWVGAIAAAAFVFQKPIKKFLNG